MIRNNPRLMNVVAVICLCAVFALAVIAAFAPHSDVNVPESPKITPAPADRVYVTPSGTRYHRRSCVSIEDSVNLIGYSPIAARREGYAPCQICEP